MLMKFTLVNEIHIKTVLLKIFTVQALFFDKRYFSSRISQFLLDDNSGHRLLFMILLPSVVILVSTVGIHCYIKIEYWRRIGFVID